MKTPCLRLVAASMAITAITASSAFAQQPGAKQPDRPAKQELVIKVYRVIDLVLPTPNYAFRGTELPGVTRQVTGPVFSGGGLGGAGMGGMGGGGGSGGGGMFNVPDQHYLAQFGGVGVGGMAAPQGFAQPAGQGASLKMTMEDLIQGIQNLVDPSTWSTMGGEGALVAMGGSLVINQTPDAHAKIADMLASLREENGALAAFSIKARWLQLPSGHVDGLGARSLTSAELDDLAATERFSGRITCFDGQTVHIISGRLHAVVGGAIPVVGGEAIGYQPLVSVHHIGALLQVTPSLLPGEDSVLIDLQSSVTRWAPPGEPIQLHGQAAPSPEQSAGPSMAEVHVDRPNVAAQQLATSLRVRLDKPTIVGGLTFPTADADDAPAEPLYLVIEVSLAPSNAAPPANPSR